ncbi:MAG: ATP-binding protein [Coriobacteriia bacterium]|nr:ATP-binding protein [Coriobacteriia bacterium]
MRYLPRHGEKTIRELSQQFGAILVTGMRQVGKSTLLEHATDSIEALSFDDAATFQAAAATPELFFSYNPPPLFLDEIQKAPDLFTEMKMIIDRTKEKGLFFLSGSQQFSMMEQVSDSLAGRIGILNLCGLSQREMHGMNFYRPFLPTRDYYSAHKDARLAPHNPREVWRAIHRGSFPELALDETRSWSQFYGAYVRAYIERDVRQITQIADEYAFQTFMGLLAARLGQALDLAKLAQLVGISSPTAKRWLSVLLTSNVVYLLQPYQANLSKRIVKSPKLYFTDTGLAAYLSKWTSAEALQSGAMAGAYFENYVIIEVLKSYYNSGILHPPLYYYRDKDQKEIDLIIDQDGMLHPLEIKMTGAPSSDDIKSFDRIDTPHRQRGAGGVLCLAKTLQPLSMSDSIIPVSYL